jgi:ribosomal protein S18 acetylase RimI-like enzyme
MELKVLTNKDIQDIINLEKVHAPDRPYYAKYDEKALDFIFDNPKVCKAYGLFDNGKLIGWGAYRSEWSEYNSKEEGIFEISSIVVNQEYRRKGIGKQILDKLFEDIKKSKHFKKIYLTVSPKNLGALLLYLKNGFEIYDFKKDIYGPGADRVYLSRE